MFSTFKIKTFFQFQGLLTDRNSHIFKHLHNSTNCKNHYTPNCFKILDSANTTYTLKLCNLHLHTQLKEAIHIQNRKPKLNTNSAY